MAIFDDRPVRIVEPCGHQRGVVPGFPDAHGEEDAVRLDGVAVRQFQLHHELHRVGAMRQVGRRYAERPVGRRAGDAPVLGVRAVHIAAQGLRAGTAQGVGYAEGLAACYGRGDVERAAQGQLHHVDAPRHLGHLHLRAFADLHTHPHGIGAHTHILRHVHRVRAACGYGLRQRAGVRTLSDGHGHTAGVAGALSGRGVRLVVGVGQLHLVAGLDGLVRGDARQHDLRRGHRAATAAREHVARADDLPGLVQQGERIGLVRALADFIELQGGAVGGGLLVYLGRHALAADRVRRVLVHRLVYLHHRDVQVRHTLPVGGKVFRGCAFRHPDFLDGITAAVPVPRRSRQEGRHVRSLEAVVEPLAGGRLESDHHAGLVLVGDVGICQRGHGGFLRVVSGAKRMELRHIIKAVAASSAARLHQVAVLVTPRIQRVAADIYLVLQDGRPRIVKIHVRSRQAVVASSPVVAVFAVRIYASKHLQAFYIDDLRHVCAGYGIHRPAFHDAAEPGGRPLQGSLGRRFILGGGLLGLAGCLVGGGGCGIGRVLGFRGRTGRCIGCLGGRIGGLRGGISRGRRVRGGLLEQRHRYVDQFAALYAWEGVHPVQRGYRFQFLHALALRLDGIEPLLYVFL